MNEKVNLTKTNGTTISGDVICYLEDTTSSKRYLYYTLNEVVGTDPTSTVKIYVGKIKQDATLDTPITDEEWGKLKGIMGEVLKNTKNATIKYIPLSELTDPTIVDEKVIAMPTNYDYINKHRGAYAEAIATSGDKTSGKTLTPVAEPEPIIDTNTIEPEKVEASQVGPVIEPQVQASEPIVEPQVQVSEPIVENAIPAQEPVSPIEEPKAQEPTEEPVNSITNLEKIDISSIEAKYDEMIKSINRLKEQEIEAANRYNATLELSALHNEQHATYVQNEQNKTMEQEVANTVVEPTPVVTEPLPVESTPTPTNIETNWFDMPAQ